MSKQRSSLQAVVVVTTVVVAILAAAGRILLFSDEQATFTDYGQAALLAAVIAMVGWAFVSVINARRMKL